MLKNHDVAVANVLPNHRIARNAQRKGVPRWFEADGLDGDGNALARLLLTVAAETGGNRAEQGNFDNRCTEDRLKGVREAKRTRLAVLRDIRFPSLKPTCTTTSITTKAMESISTLRQRKIAVF
jgi:hypothetical protein